MARLVEFTATDGNRTMVNVDEALYATLRKQGASDPQVVFQFTGDRHITVEPGEESLRVWNLLQARPLTSFDRTK